MSLTDDEFDPKPVKVSEGVEVTPGVIEIGAPSSWRVTQRACSPGQHQMVPDETEKEFEAEVCAICHIGRLIRPKAEAGL